MECHIDVDAGSEFVHTIAVTATKKHDITQTAKLLQEDDKVGYGDSSYIGARKHPKPVNNKHFHR